MNDFFNDPKAFLLALLGALWVALVGVLTWIGKGYVRRLEHLERNFVSKADLNAKHQENLGNFAELKELIRHDQEDARRSRHDLRDKIGVVAGQVARIEGQISGRYPRIER